ncbi:MAG: phenylalanine--tRNA ligase subunit beta [Flavobacteriaceae bacterium]|nr:phenylalanine--tRNA ligase subunit beta [Flavobacteriaceae bacterium]
MNISFNWLSEFLKINLKIEEVSEILTDIGLEVEGIEKYEQFKGGLEGLIVGEVVYCEQHPNADRLKLTKVNIGNESILQIVCGAPNVKLNQKVIVATVGTVLHPLNNEKFKITKSKIRGEISQGMICAEDEIGIGNSHDGIIVLNTKHKPGTKISKIYENYSDQVFNIGLTPNRSDAMSHLGVARDLRAALMHKGHKGELITPSVSSFHINSRTQKVNINVQDSNLCPRFTGVCIENISVKESPSWLQNRLKSIGLTPLNNVVDITNFVLHEIGQPLHAYDFDKITTKSINVKTLSEGTEFTTLDGDTRKLLKTDLMICDADTPMCIAGVFGGQNHGITNETKSIFLESAYFDPVSIRKTAKHHGINSDASFRFERGICIDSVDYALKRAAILICELCGGNISSDVIDEFPKKPEEKSILLNFNKTNKLIGQEIPREEIKSILTSLDFKINNITETGVGITVPFYRHDVTRECDVIEEILRIFGYNEIKLSNNLSLPIVQESYNKNHKTENTIANLLIPFGFNEIMNNSLTSNKLNVLNRESVNIINSISSDISQLRTSLLESSLKTLKFNLNRKNKNNKFFEFGKIYEMINNKTTESKRLSVVFANDLFNNTWNNKSGSSDFYYLKNIILNIFSKLSINTTEKIINHDAFNNTLGLFHKKNNIALIGDVKNQFLSEFAIKNKVYYASLDLDYVLELINDDFIKYNQLSKFPNVKRELNFLLENNVKYNEIENYILNQSNIKNLNKMTLSDVYEDDKLPKGKKSYTLNFTLLDQIKTLSEKEISLTMNKIQSKIESKFNAELRS